MKNFKEMMAIDVSPFCKTREAKDDRGRSVSISYLPWAKCVTLLHDNGFSKVWFEPCVNEKGSSLFMADQVFTDKNGVANRCYEVRVRITLDDETFEAQFPLMNGSNPVKDNSLTQQRVWNAQTRAFVKGVAMRTGLGFSLWAGEDDEGEPVEDLSSHNVLQVKKRLMEKYTVLIKKGMTTGDIAAALGMSPDMVKTVFTYPDQLDDFEKRMDKLL